MLLMVGRNGRCIVDTAQPRIISGLTLAATPTAVPLARALIRLSHNHWGFPELIEDSELLVSELATNAIQASPALAFMRIHIGLFTSVARIEVWDRGDGRPQPVPSGGTDEGGRGLLLVEALAAEWGWSVRRGRFGKVVWAELKLPHEPVSPYGMGLPVLPSVDDGRDLAVLCRVRDGLKRL
jgi:anti-sigma regulatory factor (Ser/Thr protein kinase)